MRTLSPCDDGHRAGVRRSESCGSSTRTLGGASERGGDTPQPRRAKGGISMRAFVRQGLFTCMNMIHEH